MFIWFLVKILQIFIIKDFKKLTFRILEIDIDKQIIKKLLNLVLINFKAIIILRIYFTFIHYINSIIFFTNKNIIYIR